MNPTELALALETLAEIEAALNGPAFMGRPDRWWDAHTWRCTNDHVSTTYLASETAGALCLACHNPLYLTFPEDTDGPLNPARLGLQVCMDGHPLNAAGRDPRQPDNPWPTTRYWTPTDDLS